MLRNKFARWLYVAVWATVAACPGKPGDPDDPRDAGDVVEAMEGGGVEDDVAEVADFRDEVEAEVGGDGVCTPEEEVCDGLDNDCDRLTDEDFDLRTDPNNCGECGFVCVPLPNA